MSCKEPMDKMFEKCLALGRALNETKEAKFFSAMPIAVHTPPITKQVSFHNVFKEAFTNDYIKEMLKSHFL